MNGGVGHTLPTAQSIMSSRGKLARGMVVVFHHIGRPRHRTINQNDRMTRERLRESEGFSGGGSLRREVMWAATAAGGVVDVPAIAGWTWVAMSTSWAVVADMAALATLCRSSFVVVVGGGGSGVEVDGTMSSCKGGYKPDPPGPGSGSRSGRGPPSCKAVSLTACARLVYL